MEPQLFSLLDCLPPNPDTKTYGFYLLNISQLCPFLFFPSYWLSQGPQGLLPGPLRLPTLPHLSYMWHILLSSHPSFHLYGKSLCPVIFEKPQYDMIVTSSSQPHPLKPFWFCTTCRIKLKMSSGGPLQSGTVYLPFPSLDHEPLEGRVWVLSRLCSLCIWRREGAPFISFNYLLFLKPAPEASHSDFQPRALFGHTRQHSIISNRKDVLHLEFLDLQRLAWERVEKFSTGGWVMLWQI